MHKLTSKVENWTQYDRDILLKQLFEFFRKYDIAEYYVVGSRCNGIDDPSDIDISLDVRNDIISWRRLNLSDNYSELCRRAISERRLKEYFGDKFNVIIEKECSQIYYKTIEKFAMPYYDLKTGKLYNKQWNEKFPYKIVTYDYDNHIFYIKLRDAGLTPNEIVFYTNKIYENLNIRIDLYISIDDKLKKWIEKSPYKLISFLSILSKYNYYLDDISMEYIKNRATILKESDMNKIRRYIKEAVNRNDSDIFIKLFHVCEIYENLLNF